MRGYAVFSVWVWSVCRAGRGFPAEFIALRLPAWKATLAKAPQPRPWFELGVVTDGQIGQVNHDLP